MFSYLIRRILYAVPILLGVMVLTFFLFFVVQKPETMARNVLGKRATPQTIAEYLHKRGYDKPRFINREPGQPFYDSIFFTQLQKLATFDLGVSDVTGRDLKTVFKEGAIPSLLLTLPAFFVGFIMAVGLALYLVFVRETRLDAAGALVSIALMSVPPMIYIIFGQAVIALTFNYFPAFGFELSGLTTLKFLLLPVSLIVVMGLGSDVRLYRAIFLEEIGQDYVRTAQAKGVSSTRLLLVHVLKNGMIALITLVVAHLPLLVMGSLLIENFFGIPGLGNLLVSAIQTSDFATVRASVYLGSILYLIGLAATDVCYALVDPRIRLS
ncbi:MAG: Binding-protein-dependent transport system inner rane component [Chthoniobacteraceae bacterium]|nr:Binding-protein-dependent transport system inner rane component [Chthoniobacteraceae bacterium]